MHMVLGPALDRDLKDPKIKTVPEMVVKKTAVMGRVTATDKGRDRVMATREKETMAVTARDRAMAMDRMRTVPMLNPY